MKLEKKSKGFSLVEVALAMLVAAIGVLAVVGLFATSLDTSNLATADTQEALFGDAVLNSVRMLASNTNDPWSSITTGLSVPVPCPGEWTSPTALTAFSGPVPLQSKNQNISFVSQSGSVAEYSFVCSLQIWDKTPSLKAVQFLVTPGHGTSTQIGTNAVITTFYTEINRGDGQ